MTSDSISRHTRYPWYARLMFALQRRSWGRLRESSSLLERIPRAFLALTLLYRALDRKSSPLEPALRSLLAVRVSQINWCEFCVDLIPPSHWSAMSEESKLDALKDFEHSPFFSEREKAALAYAESMVRSGGKADKALMARLKKYFDDTTIIELTTLVVFQNPASRLSAAVGIRP